MKFSPHEIDWTPLRVRRFWDWYSSNRALDDTYFARHAGRALIAYVSKRIRIGAAVDIGCGRGDLIGFLIERGFCAYGIDQSPASVEMVNKRFPFHQCFKGASVIGDSLPDNIADTAFMLEVVEHMDDDALGLALTEARRLLKPGGHLVLTTPNDEVLDALKIMCPDCGTVFHKMQHVRSWTADSLSEYVARFGFTKKSAEAIVLSPYPWPLSMLYSAARKAKSGAPNLVYIGSLRVDHVPISP